MKTYQENKEKRDRTSSESKEADFFICVGMLLLEFEECSDSENVTPTKVTSYKEEDLKKWK